MGHPTSVQFAGAVIQGAHPLHNADSAWLWTEALRVVLWTLTMRYGRTRRVEGVGLGEVVEAVLCFIVPIVGMGWT